MDSNSTLITGIAPDHWPALIAALLMPFAVIYALGALRRGAAANPNSFAATWLARYEAAPFADRVTAGLLLLTGVIHLALPLGHHDELLLTLAFLACGVLSVKLALDVFGAGRWRKPAALVLLGSIGAYVVMTASGKYEEPDQVGIATKLVELMALGLIMVPSFSRRRGLGRLVRPLASSGFVLITVLTGAGLWAAAISAHDHAHAEAASTGQDDHHGHDHGFAARAQAGFIVRPQTADAGTLQDYEDAATFALQTSAGIAKYQDVNAAIADGYKESGPAIGPKRHFENKAYQKDGLTLDPTKPELLVYGVKGNTFVLLGAAYTMEKAGDPGPDFAGPVAHWHAHNICVTPLPPAFSLVSPFGSCPLLSVDVTLPEMIHVWTVDNPNGPYAQDLSDTFVRKLVNSETP
ncbi:MAG TPA: hypothetical protein VH951_06045 [Dehalococcoidia bacterium]